LICKSLGVLLGGRLLFAKPNWLFGHSGIVELHSTNLARKRAPNSGTDLETVAARKILAREVVKYSAGMFGAPEGDGPKIDGELIDSAYPG
jgi:hypothetical protein